MEVIKLDMAVPMMCRYLPDASVYFSNIDTRNFKQLFPITNQLKSYGYRNIMYCNNYTRSELYNGNLSYMTLYPRARPILYEL